MLGALQVFTSAGDRLDGIGGNGSSPWCGVLTGPPKSADAVRQAFAGPFIEFHIFVDGAMSVKVSHALAHELAATISEEAVRMSRLITNLLAGSCVEVPCYADRDGVTPAYVGDLPPQLAALNRTNINCQE